MVFAPEKPLELSRLMLVPALAGCSLLAWSSAADATVLAPGASFTTVFGQIPGPTPSLAAPGELAADIGGFPDVSVLNGLEEFTSFNVQNLSVDLLGGGANVGSVLFFQNGGFYVGGAGPAGANPLTEQGFENLGGAQVNNRAFGVFGEGRSDIVFDTGVVSEISLQLRGTAEGLSIGPNAALGQSLPEGSALGNADATLLVYTELGLQITQSVSNSSFETLTLNVSALAGESITRLSLVNQGPVNSAIVLGELTATVVPEPASIALLGLGGVALLGRRRSR